MSMSKSSAWKSAVIVVASLATTVVSAQAPAGTQATSAVASPTYVSIPMEITVDRPAAEVWKRVGKFCDVGEWLRVNCTITAGKDGEFGAGRSVAHEVLGGKTQVSLPYT